MINTLIIEDDLGFSVEVEMLLRKLKGFEVQLATNSAEADRIISRQLPDLLLIDVKLNGSLSGIDIYQKYLKHRLPVVFFTAYNDESSYRKARQLTNAPYLIKPFDNLTLKAAIESVLKEQTSTDDFIFIKSKGKEVRLFISDIHWLKADGNYCYIHTSDEKYVLKKSIKKLLYDIDYDDLIYVHRGIVVNVNHIRSVDFRASELLIDDVKLPIGKTYRKVLKRKLKC